MTPVDLAERIDAIVLHLPSQLRGELEVARLEAQLLVLEAELRRWNHTEDGELPLDVLLEELAALHPVLRGMAEAVRVLSAAIDQVQYEGFHTLMDPDGEAPQAELERLVAGLHDFAALSRAREAES